MHKNNQRDFEILNQEYQFTDEQQRRFIQYIELLEQWHKKTNLVSTNDLPRIVGKHIRESLEILHHDLLKDGQTILDAGTGAGFPGIPVAIMFPGNTITLVDSRKVKTLFLQEAVEALALKKVDVVCQRLEKIDIPLYHGNCDLVLARAVTHLQELWFWTGPLLKPGGIMVAYKGGDLTKEIDALRNKVPGIQVEYKPFTSTPVEDEKILVQVIKSR